MAAQSTVDPMSPIKLVNEFCLLHMEKILEKIPEEDRIDGHELTRNRYRIVVAAQDYSGFFFYFKFRSLFFKEKQKGNEYFERQKSSGHRIDLDLYLKVEELRHHILQAVDNE